MATNQSCCEYGTNRLQYWSNPDKTYNGIPMGSVQYEDNARMLDEKTPTIETFKTSFTSGTLPSNQTWYYKALSGNVSIPTGVTLTIASGGTINLNNYSIVSTGGTIAVESGSSITGATLKTGSTINGIYPTIQSAVNASTSGQIINISPNTFNENVTISGKSNLFISGDYYSTNICGTLTAVNCPGLSLSSFWCYGLFANNCDNSCFNNDITSTSSEIGVSLYYCSDFIRCGYVINSLCGLLTYASDGITYSLTEFWNNYTGIASQASSDVVTVDSKLCGSVNYDFTAKYNGYIMAVNCYYNNATPRYLEQTGGNVDIIGNSYNCSGLGKRNTNTAAEKDLPAENPIETDDLALSDFRAINYSYFSLLQEIDDNAKYKEQSDKTEFYEKHMQVIDNFKKFIKNNPNSSLAKVALTTASHSFGRFEDYGAIKQFLIDIITDNNLVKLKGQAERLMVDYYRNIKDFDNAINTVDNIIKAYGDDKELICDALYAKGLILTHELNRQEEATKCFSNIVTDYSNSPLAGLAKNELELLGINIKEIKKKEEVVDNSEFRTSSYPNPFNPSTTIEYNLPVDTKVVIKVYDMVGREVKTLVNAEKAAGRYSVIFNASSLSSGVYFYSIKAGDFYQVKKLLLVK